MRILFDDLGLREPHGGVSRYFSELFKNFPSDITPIICQKECANQYMMAAPFNLPRARLAFSDFMPKSNMIGRSYIYRFLANFLPWIFPSYERVNQLIFKKHLRDLDFDILHLTAPHGATEGWGTKAWHKIIGKKPFVLTVHDLIPDKLNNNRSVIRQRQFELSAASHIIAVSNNTKRDLIELYGVPSEKISVVYHGHTEPTGQVDREVFPGMKYILYLGKRGGYKNSDFFIKAMAPLLRHDSTLNLVFTGGRFSDGEKLLFRDLGIDGQVHQKFIDDCEMMSLFRHAICFVYPSLYEGFGIPILDAFSGSCPVVLSRCSCFPEVGGDAALYFEEGDDVGLRKAVKKFIEDPIARDEFIKRGLARVQGFSWHMTANKTADVYRKVLAK